MAVRSPSFGEGAARGRHVAPIRCWPLQDLEKFVVLGQVMAEPGVLWVPDLNPGTPDPAPCKQLFEDRYVSSCGEFPLRSLPRVGGSPRAGGGATLAPHLFCSGAATLPAVLGGMGT